MFSPESLQRAIRESAARSPAQRSDQPARPSTQAKDSIWNGGLVGAAIGGVGGSLLLVAASGGSDDFGKAMLKVSPITALSGFAIGAVIDALH